MLYNILVQERSHISSRCPQKSEEENIFQLHCRGQQLGDAIPSKPKLGPKYRPDKSTSQDTDMPSDQEKIKHEEGRTQGNRSLGK